MNLLHLGCGDHKLPYPWQNYDKEVDLRERLPWGDNSARFIFAEHVIEHLTFAEGFRFLQECRRVLEPGGVLRFSFPDVTRIGPEHGERFVAYLVRQGARDIGSLSGVYRALLTGWGHQSCWTTDATRLVCYAAGFTVTSAPTYGDSDSPELKGIDGHHLTTGDEEMARLETGIMEAT